MQEVTTLVWIDGIGRVRATVSTFSDGKNGTVRYQGKVYAVKYTGIWRTLKINPGKVEL